MNRVEYVVRPNEDATWRVDREGARFGDYDSEKGALRAAIHSAHARAEQGADAEVVLCSAAGEKRVAWQPGDPYPPGP